MENYIYLKNLNNKTPYKKFFITLLEQTYILTVRWSEYCDCAFLSIADYENNPIVTGVALVNGLKIRHNNLPYEFYFIQKNGETYEPTIDNIAEEFALVFEDGE